MSAAISLTEVSNRTARSIPVIGLEHPLNILNAHEKMLLSESTPWSSLLNNSIALQQLWQRHVWLVHEARRCSCISGGLCGPRGSRFGVLLLPPHNPPPMQATNICFSLAQTDCPRNSSEFLGSAQEALFLFCLQGRGSGSETASGGVGVTPPLGKGHCQPG